MPGHVICSPSNRTVFALRFEFIGEVLRLNAFGSESLDLIADGKKGVDTGRLPMKICLHSQTDLVVSLWA